MFLKNWRFVRDGMWTLRFPCPCAIDKQRHEEDIRELAEQYFAAHPGVTRFDLDITTL